MSEPREIPLGLRTVQVDPVGEIIAQRLISYIEPGNVEALHGATGAMMDWLSHLASSPEGRAFLLRLVFSEEEMEALEAGLGAAPAEPPDAPGTRVYKFVLAALEQEGKG